MSYVSYDPWHMICDVCIVWEQVCFAEYCSKSLTFSCPPVSSLPLPLSPLALERPRPCLCVQSIPTAHRIGTSTHIQKERSYYIVSKPSLLCRVIIHLATKVEKLFWETFWNYDYRHSISSPTDISLFRSIWFTAEHFQQLSLVIQSWECMVKSV